MQDVSGSNPLCSMSLKGLILQALQALSQLSSCTGQSWSGQITCFKTNPIDCTLLAQWDDGYADPWLIPTDLNPTEGNILWDGFRSWIESSYRDVKSDGWQWQRTRLRNPERAERHWLAGVCFALDGDSRWSIGNTI